MGVREGEFSGVPSAVCTTRKKDPAWMFTIDALKPYAAACTQVFTASFLSALYVVNSRPSSAQGEKACIAWTSQ